MAIGDVLDVSNHTITERERLDQNEHILNVTVTLLILIIFTFFFIIILVILCFQWLERKSRSALGEGCLLLPNTPVPGYVTVFSSNHPHMKLLGHYQLQPFHDEEKWPSMSDHHTSTPCVLSPLQDIAKKNKRRSY